jgi:hypothetical protein
MATEMHTIKIQIAVDGDIEKLKDALHEAVYNVLARRYQIALTDIIITFEEEDGVFQRLLPLRIAELSGRSRLIAQFLYDNPGEHSTQDLNDLISRQLPFRNASILHSYLNNLISRRFVIKTSTGLYKSTRAA